MAERKQVRTIDEYISAFPADTQAILQEIRQLIRASAPPEAEEAMSYQIPAFKLRGKILVYFAAFKNHIGVYPPVPKSLGKELTPYRGPKGSLRFPNDRPIPLDLLEKIVRYRTGEVLGKGKRKKRAT